MLLGGNNPRVKYIRRLARRRCREREGKFLVEGIRFLEEAVRENWPLELALYSPGLVENPRGARLLEVLEERGVPLLTAEPALFAQLAETSSPQGIIAVAQIPRRRDPEVLSVGDNSLMVLVDGVRDPGNLGTIIRCADAYGAEGVLMLKGSVDPYNPKTLRATMGAVFRVPLLPVRDTGRLVADMEAGGWKLVAGEPAARKNIQQCRLTGRVVLAVGGETAGFTGSVNPATLERVSIPMPGRAESLNAGVAACVMLYEAVRQRMEKNNE
ncbi:MAG: RNA methyltransferase [Firmicutes bacterium]|nr:RNA methyltransferase [Bacillota bacterium]